MQPSNPASFFINGNDEEQFTYEPGLFPYYAIAAGKGHIAFSVMVFADGVDHVKLILMEMVKFAERCALEYATEASKDQHPALQGYREGRTDRIRKILEGDSDYTLEIASAPRNQLYKIGWAGNDTL